jgi:RimJ/RimL family protein N-acetyltransferase
LISLSGQRNRAGAIIDVRCMISLVPFDRSHLPATLRWVQDDDIRAGILLDRRIDAESHAHWFESASRDSSQKLYAILDGAVHIGNFGFRSIVPDDRCADLWIYLGAGSRGRGAGFAAVLVGLKIGFGDLGLRRITLIVRTDNAAAIRVYKKAGFAEEGILRGGAHFGGRPVDVLRMAKFAPSAA